MREDYVMALEASGVTKNYHRVLANLGNGVWKCVTCELEGSYQELSKEVECETEYAPCETCGNIQRCSSTCSNKYVLEGAVKAGY